MRENRGPGNRGQERRQREEKGAGREGGGPKLKGKKKKKKRRRQVKYEPPEKTTGIEPRVTRPEGNRSEGRRFINESRGKVKKGNWKRASIERKKSRGQGTRKKNRLGPARGKIPRKAIPQDEKA